MISSLGIAYNLLDIKIERFVTSSVISFQDYYERNIFNLLTFL